MSYAKIMSFRSFNIEHIFKKPVKHILLIVKIHFKIRSTFLEIVQGNHNSIERINTNGERHASVI